MTNIELTVVMDSSYNLYFEDYPSRYEEFRGAQTGTNYQ